jgi:L-lysine exporter family protein LysE/ArgO
VSAAAGVLIDGFAVSLSFIVAIGAQNTFVLRQGLRREHVGIVVAICAAADVALIVAGVAGMGALIRRVPHLLTIVTLGGAAFLLSYAVLALRRAIRATASNPTGGPSSSLRAVVLTSFALTYLNPGVYLDTVVLLGSIANSHRGHAWTFATGAALASIGWFFALGYGARVLSPLFAKPLAWRVLDISIAVVMTTIAVRLASSSL